MQSIGFNINFDMPGDMGYLTKVILDWKPAWVLGMTTGGMNDQAWHIFNVMQSYGGRFIYRLYENIEGKLWEHRTAEQQLDLMADLSKGYPIWINVGNEPRPGENEIHLLDPASPAAQSLASPTALAVSDLKLTAQEARKAGRWYSDIIRNTEKWGIRFAGPSFATGNYEKNELSWWDELWWAFIETADQKVEGGVHRNIFAVHEYDFAMPMMNTAGSSPVALIAPEEFRFNHLSSDGSIIDKPAPYDVFYYRSNENWLTYRSWWAVERMRGLINEPEWSDVSIVRTEGLHDHPPHMNAVFPEVVAQVESLAGQKVSGLPTLKKYFHEYGKHFNMTAEHLAACGLGWVALTDASSEGVYIGTTLFHWTENYNWPERWAQFFGLQNWAELLQYYPTFYENFIVPLLGRVEPPAPEPEPDPDLPAPPEDDRVDELVKAWVRLERDLEDLKTNKVSQEELRLALEEYVKKDGFIRYWLSRLVGLVS